MKRWLLVVAVIFTIGAGFYFLFRRAGQSAARSMERPEQIGRSEKPRAAEPPATVPQTAAAPSMAPASSDALSAPAASAAAATPTKPAGPVPSPLPPPDYSGPPPATVLENLRLTFHQYAAMYGGNPVGTNPEITRALNGDNPKQVRFIHPEDGLRINDKGEMVDPWGTPFFFHQLSGQVMEIHCAGPDRRMWTADDLVTK